MKKQVKKLLKKILIYGLATSIIFTSCFSYKKMEVNAMGAVVTALSAWTMYDICLALGAVAVPALGIGYVYSNRDEIAELGKTVIDSMVSNELENPDSWLFGTYNDNGSVVYDGDALVQIASQTWDFIKEGGLTPATAEDLNGDGFVDVSDKDFELANSNFWTTSDGAEYIYSQVQSIYDSWVNKEEDNILDKKFGEVDFVGFSGFDSSSLDKLKGDDGLYHGYFLYEYKENGNFITKVWEVVSSEIVPFVVYENGPYTAFVAYFHEVADTIDSFALYKEGVLKDNNYTSGTFFTSELLSGDARLESNFPVLSSMEDFNTWARDREFNNIMNYVFSFRVADWMDSEGQWMDTLDELTITLRSLQDMVDIATQVSSTALELTPTADIYCDLVADVVGTYNPIIDVVIPSPVPWNPDITRPVTSTDLPIDVVIDTDIPMPDSPGTEDDEEQDIDLNGLTSIFSILFYLIMIIIMLIYLFLACLAFIVMIFRIPASSSMLPEEMVMGFDHLKTIMIPGMNISIYGFAMALIYLLIIFTVIKILRLEINDFKFPRSGRKP